MKTIDIFLTLWLLLISGFIHASTLHVPGAQFNNLTGLPADVSELDGCYFEVQNAGFTLPDDSTVISVEVLTSNLTTTEINVSVFYRRHVGVNLPSTILSESMSVSPGHQANVLPVQPQNGYIPGDEFTAFYVYPTDDLVGICGVKIHYLDDLIYLGSFE